MDCHDYLYPYMQLILDIDQSSGHTKGRDDALRVTGGIMSWGGIQTSMRSSVVCQECLDNEPGKCLFPGNNQFMDFTKADEDEWYLQKEEGSRLTAGPCWYDSTATPHDREENQMTAEEIKKKKEQIKTKQGAFESKRAELEKSKDRDKLTLHLAAPVDERIIVIGWAEKPKGIKQILYERGKWKAGMIKSKSEKAMAQIGISCIPTPPGIPQMQIERHVQTHKEDVSTILASSPTLKASDWDITSTHACLIRSTMICAASKLKTNGMQSPYELVTGHAPRVDVFQEFGLGDVGVVKRSKANHAKYGQSKNVIVQIVGMEVNDTKAVIVEFAGQRTRARRGRVQKVHLLATEHTRLDNLDRVAKCTMDEEGVLTFTIEGEEDIQLASPNQIMEQEL